MITNFSKYLLIPALIFAVILTVKANVEKDTIIQIDENVYASFKILSYRFILTGHYKNNLYIQKVKSRANDDDRLIVIAQYPVTEVISGEYTFFQKEGRKEEFGQEEKIGHYAQVSETQYRYIPESYWRVPNTNYKIYYDDKKKETQIIFRDVFDIRESAWVSLIFTFPK